MADIGNDILTSEPNPPQSLTGTNEEAPDYGDNFEKLPDEYQAKLRSLVQKFAIRDQWARQIEILRAGLARFFWNGKQHIWWNADIGTYQVGPSGASMVSENLNEEPTYQENFNIYSGYGKSFIAVFAQNAASVRMEPRNPKEPRAISAAAEAEKYRRVYEKYNPPKAQQINIARILWTDGRVISHTRYVADGAKFGFEEDGSIEEQSSKTKRTPLGQELTHYYGVLESKCPLYENDFADWPYCVIYSDHDICTMKEKYPDFADKIQATGKGSTPNEEIARLTRIATAENVTQLSQDSLAYIVTEQQWWLRPSAFQELSNEDRDFFKRLYPDGCQVTFVGQTYVGSRNENMSDHLAVMHAMPGTGQSRPALGDFEIPIQIEFNDALNLTAELLKYCIPSIWADIDKATIEAIAEQKSEYGAFRPFKRPSGEPMESFFFPEPQIQAPAILPQWAENLQGPLSQFVTGQQPALFGQQMADQKTAAGYAMARDQALGLMIVTWVPFKQFYAQIVEQSVKAASHRENDIVAIVESGARSGKTETINVDVKTLRTSVLCTPETDENFPESWTQKSNKYMSLITGSAQNPLLGQILQQPDNLALGKDLYGLEDLVIPGADSRDKQLDEIAQLLEEEPVLDQAAMQQQFAMQQQQAMAAQAAGQPYQPQPIAPQFTSSVPIDSDCDDHGVEAAECLRWINSPEGQKARKNPQTAKGFENVRLHFLEHKRALAQQQQTQQQPKPPSESISFKDLPPEGQQQMAAQAGIQLAPLQPELQGAANNG